MSADATRPSTVPWPPILYCGAVIAALLLHWFLPLPWIGQPLSDILFAVGWLVIAGGLAFVVTAIRTLTRHRTAVNPTKASDHLVTDGPYALTRNPIYLGNTLMMFGIGLASGIVWFIALGLVAAFATKKLAIEGEERHLQQKFAKRFRDYSKKTRRWI